MRAGVDESGCVDACASIREYEWKCSQEWIRVSTSALVGDPDPYPQVYRLTKFKLRSM